MECHIYNNQERTIDEAGLKALAASVWQAESDRAAAVSLIFVANDYIRELNKTYLGKDNPTDVIAFPLSDDPALFEGEIYVSTQQVQANAATYEVSFEEELRRVVVHAVLHFLGYADKTPQERSLMRQKENHYLQSLA